MSGETFLNKPYDFLNIFNLIHSNAVDWLAIGISWMFSTVTTFLIIFIALCVQRRSANKSIDKKYIEKETAIDEKTINYIPSMIFHFLNPSKQFFYKIFK